MSAPSGSHKASVAHESRGEKLPSPLKVRLDCTGISFLTWSGSSHSLYSRKHEVITCPVPSYQCNMNCSERRYVFWPSQTMFLIQENSCTPLIWIYEGIKLQCTPSIGSELLWCIHLCPTFNIPLFPYCVMNSSGRDDQFPVWFSEPPMSLDFLRCLSLSVLFLIPLPPQSIHAPDLLQTIRNLWTLTLLMLLSV